VGYARCGRCGSRRLRSSIPAAYGPSSVADIGTWSWLTGLREVVERLRPNLRIFRDEDGRELFDVPEGARPDADTPAPVRFLPEYDNALLSHSDRTRIVPRGRKVPLPPGNGAAIGTFLVDGFLRGTWRIDRGDGLATMMVAPDTVLSLADQAALEEEGDALLRLAAPGLPKRVGGLRRSRRVARLEARRTARTRPAVRARPPRRRCDDAGQVALARARHDRQLPFERTPSCDRTTSGRTAPASVDGRLDLLDPTNSAVRSPR
jgi:hypothetical protein